MIALSRRLAPLLFALLAVACAGGQVHRHEERPAAYLSAMRLAAPDFPSPPAPGSDADKADFAELHRWQRARTPAECARANAEAHATFDEFFGKISPLPTPRPPEAEAVLARVWSDTGLAITALKKRYRRPRPFLVDKTLEPCLGRVGGLAYPSGHSTSARVFALLLSDLVPSRRAEFLARADEAALDRVIGGVHHPTDIEAGKRLGDEVYAGLRESPAFRADLETLRRFVVARQN